ncbi:MAG: hypothetical protein LUB56_00920 [Coprobacillus sp.]|nr:hypothetical protein [Coprobacillus sp.]
MKFKKLMSLSTLCVVGVLGVGLLTGCNNDDDNDVPSDDVDETDTETETGPQPGAVFGNALNMLSGFTFEGSIDIAYGDIEVGLEFSNGEAVIPLDSSDLSWDGSKLAIGGDLTIKYNEYNITLGVTYLDSAVYVDYGEDSYWSEGVGNAVHFYMENSDIGDLINLFSSDDEDASSVDWEALFGLDLTDFQVMDLVNDLGAMDLTTAKDGSPAFAFSLISLGIDDSILIRTNNNSECTGLECSEVELGEFTLSIDLSLTTKKGLEVTTPVEQSLYQNLGSVGSLVSSIVDIVNYRYFYLTGDINFGYYMELLGIKIDYGVNIPTTLVMKIGDDGEFTMLLDCDVEVKSLVSDGGNLTTKTFHEASTGLFGTTTAAYWSDDSGVESRHVTIYYDSTDGNTYFHRTDTGVGHTYTEAVAASATKYYDDDENTEATENDYTVDQTYNTYEVWGKMSGSFFGSAPIRIVLGDMLGSGDTVMSALGGGDDDGGLDLGFGIPSSFNGLITSGSLTEVLDEEEQNVIGRKYDLGLSIGGFISSESFDMDKAELAVTLDPTDDAITGIYALVNIDLGSLGLDLSVGLTLDSDKSGETAPSYSEGQDPFTKFTSYIEAHTCTCEECECDGECDEDCECCSEGCECYFIQDKIVDKLSLNTELKCSCGCESCVLGQCNCAEGSCECGECTCAPEGDEGGDTEPDDEEP